MTILMIYSSFKKNQVNSDEFFAWQSCFLNFGCPLEFFCLIGLRQNFTFYQ
jgi:hypothetical protein